MIPEGNISPHFLVLLSKTHYQLSEPPRGLIELLDKLLVITETISMGVCLISLLSHRKFHLESRDFTTTQEYFMSFIPEERSLFRESKIEYTTLYRESSYYIIDITRDPGSGLSVLHRVMVGAFFFLEEAPQSSENVLCDFHDFTEVIEATNIEAAPSSYYSMCFLSISTFCWGAYLSIYIHRYLLEKLIPITTMVKNIFRRKLERILSGCFVKKSPALLDLTIYYSMALLTLLGLYTTKQTNIDLDNYYICLWEISKILLICISGLSYEKLTYRCH